MCDLLDVMVHVQYEEPCLDLELKPITRGMRKGGVGKYCVCVTYLM